MQFLFPHRAQKSARKMNADWQLCTIYVCFHVFIVKSLSDIAYFIFCKCNFRAWKVK